MMLGNVRSDEGDSNQNVKNCNRYDKENNESAYTLTLFGVHFFAVNVRL